MKEKKIPMRRCVGCNTSKPKGELIRISAYGGDVKIDDSGRANGRGIYLCISADCFTKAKKRKSISRNLEIDISEQELERLFEELKEYER